MISAFYTTLQEAENSPKTHVLSTIKASMCIPRQTQAYNTKNHEKIPFFYALLYGLNTFYLKTENSKCI